jgi:ABC-2 type transport system ATP-binding protein
VSIEVINLTRIYGVQRAVDNISFQVGKGEILGFLGPNGAGKSTTMKVTTCYIPPTSGTVKVSGHDVREAPMEVKRSLGYLAESNPLYMDMYVHEYLNFIASVHKINRQSINQRIASMIELCGLGLEQKKKIGTLSKGYKQRVGLAQALIHDPQVLILDEPTTGLDPNQILEIRELITTIGKEKTVIFSTHILQEVQAICSRVIIINHGKIVADDSVKDLKNLHGSRKIIHLEFERSIDTEKLRTISEIIEIRLVEPGKYQLDIIAGKDIRNDIFRIASENNLPLLGLKQEEISLENVFKKLTDEGKKE